MRRSTEIPSLSVRALQNRTRTHGFLGGRQRTVLHRATRPPPSPPLRDSERRQGLAGTE